MNLKWVNLMQTDHNCFDTFYPGSSLTFIKMVMHMTDDGRKKNTREKCLPARIFQSSHSAEIT